MKYKNASDILPDKLLRELQKYASGEAIYVPAEKEKKKWGDNSGARAYYRERNDEIRTKFYKGADMEILAVEYSLSVDTIRKIVYK